MPPLTGTYVIAELHGPAAERVRAVQREFDPKLAAWGPPHVTLAGSSGMGPIRSDVPDAELRARLEPVAAVVAPMTLRFHRPHRFMQTNVVVLPLDHNGPLRDLHERIRSSGLPYAVPRFTFSPHATLSFFREIPAAVERRLLAVRVDEPLVIESITVSRTRDPFPPELLFTLPLLGGRT